MVRLWSGKRWPEKRVLRVAHTRTTFQCECVPLSCFDTTGLWNQSKELINRKWAEITRSMGQDEKDYHAILMQPCMHGILAGERTWIPRIDWRVHNSDQCY